MADLAVVAPCGCAILARLAATGISLCVTTVLMVVPRAAAAVGETIVAGLLAGSLVALAAMCGGVGRTESEGQYKGEKESCHPVH